MNLVVATSNHMTKVTKRSKFMNSVKKFINLDERKL